MVKFEPLLTDETFEQQVCEPVSDLVQETSAMCQSSSGNEHVSSQMTLSETTDLATTEQPQEQIKDVNQACKTDMITLMIRKKVCITEE